MLVSYDCTFLCVQGYFGFDKEVIDWLTLTIGRDYRQFRTKLKRMDRISINYVLDAFELVENNNQCRYSEALKRQKAPLERPRMQQDINIIDQNADHSISTKNELISELKQIVESKQTVVEKQRRIIENQNDRISKINEEKDRMKRDILNLKQEMEMDRSRKYLK